MTELRRELSESWERGDLSAFMMLIDQDAVVLPPLKEALEGSELIRRWARGEIGVVQWVGPPGEEGLVISGDVGFAVWPSGPEVVEPRSANLDSRGLEAYRRGPDGRWRLMRLVWNRRSSETEG